MSDCCCLPSFLDVRTTVEGELLSSSSTLSALYSVTCMDDSPSQRSAFLTYQMCVCEKECKWHNRFGACPRERSDHGVPSPFKQRGHLCAQCATVAMGEAAEEEDKEKEKETKTKTETKATLKK